MTQKIAIKIDHQTYVILAPEDAAALLPHLCRLRYVKQEGYSADCAFVATDYSPEIRLIDDSRLPPAPLGDMVQNAIDLMTKAKP